MTESTRDSRSGSRHEWFVTTHWSVVLASRRSDSTQARAALGKLCQIEQLKECLTSGGCGEPYAQLAAKLGMTEGAVKVAVHRLRQRYRQLLEEEIAHTVTSPDEVIEERRYLLSVLSL